jgi:anti-sigma factor RsiW
MTPERALTIIEAYGADPRRWPADERDAARALIARTPELAAALAREAAMDAVLAAAPPAPDVMLNPAAIALQAQRAAIPARARSWLRGGALIAATLAGFIFGWVQSSLQLDDRGDWSAALEWIEEDAL